MTNAISTIPPNTILRLPVVKTRTGLCRSTIYLRMSQGTFPKQVSLGGRTVGWLESEIEEWISSRVNDRHFNRYVNRMNMNTEESDYDK